MTNKTLQQTDKEFKVKTKILKEIEETDWFQFDRGRSGVSILHRISSFQSQLKNLSKEKEKPEKIKKLKINIASSDMEKEASINVDVVVTIIEKINGLIDLSHSHPNIGGK